MKLIVSLIELIVSQCQLVIIYSVLWGKNSSKGKRLRRNENLIDEAAYDGKSISFGRLVMEMMIGVVSKIKIMRIEDVIIFITFIWSCTKVFGS